MPISWSSGWSLWATPTPKSAASPSTTSTTSPIPPIGTPNSSQFTAASPLSPPLSAEQAATLAPEPTIITPTSHYASDLTTRPARLRKQATLYFGGVFFLYLTTFFARRSLRRRHLAGVPKYYTSSVSPVNSIIPGGGGGGGGMMLNMNVEGQNFNPGLDAFEALNIATLGVVSLGMMMVGGAMCVFDVVNVEETRRLVRMRYGGDWAENQSAELEELEEWVASVLARKEKKEKEREGKA